MDKNRGDYFMPKNIISHLNSTPHLEDIQKKVLVSSLNYYFDGQIDLNKLKIFKIIYLPDLLKYYPWDFVLNFDWSKTNTEPSKLGMYHNMVLSIKESLQQLVKLKSPYVVTYFSGTYIPIINNSIYGLLNWSIDTFYQNTPIMLIESMNSLFGKQDSLDYIKNKHNELSLLIKAYLMLKKQAKKYPRLNRHIKTVMQSISQNQHYDSRTQCLFFPCFYTDYNESTENMVASVTIPAYVNRVLDVESNSKFINKQDIKNAIKNNKDLTRDNKQMDVQFIRFTKTIDLDKNEFNQVCDYKLNKINNSITNPKADLYLHIKDKNNVEQAYAVDTKNKLYYKF